MLTRAHSHTWPFPSPVLTHPLIYLCTLLPKYIPHNRSHSSRLRVTHSQTLFQSHHAPKLTYTGVETSRAFTSDTRPPPAPTSPIPGTLTDATPPPCAPPLHPPTIHSYTPAAAESSTSGAPRPPQPAHTYGKLPKVAEPPSPSARGRPLSGYQEVNGECQEGGSSPLPV